LYKSATDSSVFYPDWVAGMFMLLKSSTYENLEGFDEKYFLYYEDIDLCLRSWRAKSSVIVSKNVSIVHKAQRDSHANLGFFILHLKSMCRFFVKHWLRFPR
jgi:N-acetylglucosaminyl-diphospho-decaprenol L-rhamnosyltransferase